MGIYLVATYYYDFWCFPCFLLFFLYFNLDLGIQGSVLEFSLYYDDVFLEFISVFIFLISKLIADWNMTVSILNGKLKEMLHPENT